MENGIHQDLQRTDHRDAQLWFLALGLLILFGGIMIAGFIFMMSELSPDAVGPVEMFYRALGGLAFLISLFCFYVIQARSTNAAVKSLLVEMNSMAASSKKMEEFLPSIACKIGKAGSANTCQVVLLGRGQPTLEVRAASSDGVVEWSPRLETVYELGDLPVCREALETRVPILLQGEELARRAKGPERELLTGAFQSVASVLVLPMVTQGQALGVIILGREKRFLRRSFTSSQINMTTVLAGHAATAIDQSVLKREAVHDPLTNLYNRRHFSLRLREEMARANRQEQIMVILLCDMDRFKEINDTRGHQVGDSVLKAIAESIQASTRGTDLVFRWGGDEIVVILSDSTREGGLRAAHRIREGVRHTGDTFGYDLDVSIGVALYPEHGKSEHELIRTADRALYIAKKSGRHLHIGEEEYELNQDAVKVVFQPIVDIASGNILGYEALSRDPKGEMGVADFFKKFQVIGQLNQLKQIIFSYQVQLAQDLKLRRVFINADFEVLAKIDPIPTVSGTNVVIELSELEALHDLDENLRIAERWRAKGYRFAIDDFGAGFISLPFLAMLTPDFVKVDRTTILQAVSSEKFRKFLTTLLHAVRAYATSGIIAEGVEEQRELEFVKEMDISLVQGYLFGRPQVIVGPAPHSLGELLDDSLPRAEA